jgi:hypothetical protein
MNINIKVEIIKEFNIILDSNKIKAIIESDMTLEYKVFTIIKLNDILNKK